MDGNGIERSFSVIVHDIASGAKASGPWSCSSRPSAAGASAREERARAARPAECRASYEAVVNAIVIEKRSHVVICA